MTGYETPSLACARRPDEIGTDGFSSKDWPEQFAANGGGGGGVRRGREAAPFALGLGFNCVMS
ncbi:hypothetical protein F511_19309 [Dorcoceras hygrometricum]|uniref:Uncharacterized protein n=1 Tax=Dorcoceras hygrometricum TaxID=472368 RepID=A0A2Z7AX26_9LAMI|nr:hypothetical protein F511_19309 [Dorcoceras hygrometricum]